MNKKTFTTYIYRKRRKIIHTIIVLSFLFYVVYVFHEFTTLHTEEFEEYQLMLKNVEKQLNILKQKKKKNSQEYEEIRANQMDIEEQPIDKTKWQITYPIKELVRWEPREPIKEEKGLPGEMNAPVVLNAEEQVESKKKFSLHQFDIVASDKIRHNRSLKDLRHEQCKNKRYPPLLPPVSIVIVFHKEAWSTLMRTIWSVINRSPKTLLHEFILVDDKSELEYLNEQLENYAKYNLPVKTTIIRMPKRSGLIQARLTGARQVQSNVMVFLDSHVEVTDGWLEPLLERIATNRTRVVNIALHSISDYNFEFRPTKFFQYGGFDWKMNYNWIPVPQRILSQRTKDYTEPVQTATFIGGLYAIDKEFFFNMGAYDENMDTWGGENLEMSFRIWMCGGSMEIVPCSNAGHVFRHTPAYKFPGGIKDIYKNYRRFVEVWMDEFKEFFYSVHPGADKVEYGDISARKNLRKKLGCHNFRWYLENVYVDALLPLDFLYFGKVKNGAWNICLDSLGRKAGENVGGVPCHQQGGFQVLAYTEKKKLIAGGFCLSSNGQSGPVQLQDCHDNDENQEWTLRKEEETIRHTKTGLCLQSPDLESPVDKKGRKDAMLRLCMDSVEQKWWFIFTAKDYGTNLN